MLSSKTRAVLLSLPLMSMGVRENYLREMTLPLRVIFLYYVECDVDAQALARTDPF
jgi:hypothetical protein